MKGFDWTHPGWWALGWSILSFMASASVGLYVWLTDRDRVRIKRIEAVEAELRNRLSDAVDEQGPMRMAIATLQEAQRHAPSRDELRAIEVQAHHRMDSISETLNELRGSAKRVELQLDMISQYLMGAANGRG